MAAVQDDGVLLRSPNVKAAAGATGGRRMSNIVYISAVFASSLEKTR